MYMKYAVLETNQRRCWQCGPRSGSCSTVQEAGCCPVGVQIRGRGLYAWCTGLACSRPRVWEISLLFVVL